MNVRFSYVCYYMFCEGMESFYVAKTCGDAQFQEEWMWEDLVEGITDATGEMERQGSMWDSGLTECYQRTTETLDETIRISISQDNKVSGTIDASIEDDENGYYTTYGGDFSGELWGKTLTVTVSIEIEGDVMEETETWILNKEKGTLIKGNFVHQLTKCQ